MIDRVSKFASGYLVAPRVDWHLLNWRDYMRSGGTRGLGAPTSACGFVGGGYNNDFDSMCLEADSVAAKTMDALISSLTPIQQAAIYHEYLQAVYRFPSDNLEDQLQAACDHLARGMAARGLV